jgi:hypothetical protein
MQITPRELYADAPDKWNTSGGGVEDSVRIQWELRWVLEREDGFADAEEIRQRFSTSTRDELTAAKEAIGAVCQQDRETGRWWVLLPGRSPALS